MALLVTGCARTVPVEVQDVNRGLGEAKDACATVYAADQLSGVQGGVDQMNRLVDDNKYRKARKEAEGLAPQVANLKTEADAGRAAAKGKADAAMKEASAALDSAKKVGAAEYASKELQAAEAKMAAATAAAGNPCDYGKAEALAMEAAKLAEGARTAAIAEKKRREEEEARRLAEEEARRKAEEEARRKAEEAARLAAIPTEYEVKKGDYLWKISGMEKIYQAPKFWPLLFDGNRGQIQDPDLIYPGQKLSIPRVSDEEMMQKLHVMWSRAAQGGEL
jgi:nucleoid-associated protein YgaU